MMTRWALWARYLLALAGNATLAAIFVWLAAAADSRVGAGVLLVCALIAAGYLHRAVFHGLTVDHLEES